MSTNSIEAILAKTKKRGIKVNERYESLADEIEDTARGELSQSIESPQIKSDEVIMENGTPENEVVETRASENEVVETKASENEVVETKASENEVVETKASENEVVETKASENEVVETKASKNGSFVKKLKMFKSYLKIISNFTTQEQRMMNSIIEKTDHGIFKNVPISNDEFVLEGVHKNYIKESIKGLEEKNIILFDKMKIDGRIRNVYSMNEEFLKNI